MKKPKIFSSYLPVILTFILGDVICDNQVFRAFHAQTPACQFCLFLGALLLQTISAPIQSAFSDLYCRKKSLIISLSSSFLALLMLYLYHENVLFFFPVLMVIIFLKCGLGNTIPLSWASIADTQSKNFRFSFALSTSSYAVAYLLVVFSNKIHTASQSILALLHKSFLKLAARFLKCTSHTVFLFII